MTKQELINQVAKAGYPKATVAAVLDHLVATTTKAVAAGDEIAIPGLGTFKSADRAARTGRNPLTGEKLKIAAKRVPKFSAATGFKAAVASGKKSKRK